jgi:HAD superfamily hydrolase (TIGR01509 family)
MLEAIFVDFDGTLVNTELANAKAYTLAIKNMGFDIDDKKVFEVVKGRHWSIFLPELIGEVYTEEIGRTLAMIKAELYPNFFREIELNKALVEFLREISSFVEIALVTNASVSSVKQIIEYFGIFRLFDSIVTLKDNLKPKPSPDLYLYALQETNVSPDAVIVIEDSEAGVLAAEKAGLKVWKVSPF